MSESKESKEKIVEEDEVEGEDSDKSEKKKESPKRNFELLDLSNIAALEKEALDFKNPKYKVMHKKNNMLIQLEKGGLAGPKTIRMYATLVGVDPADVFEMLLDVQYGDKYDSASDTWSVIDVIDEERSVTFYRTKSPFPALVNKREFLLTRICKKFSKDKFVIYGKTIPEHPKCPKTVKNCVRGVVTYNFFLIRRDPKKPKNTLFLYFTRANLMGKIPASIGSWVTGKVAPSFIKQIRINSPIWRDWRKKVDELGLKTLAEIKDWEKKEKKKKKKKK